MILKTQMMMMMRCDRLVISLLNLDWFEVNSITLMWLVPLFEFGQKIHSQQLLSLTLFKFCHYLSADTKYGE